MKRAYALLLAAVLLLSGCQTREKPLQKYQGGFFEAFDTYTTVIGYAESQDAFDQTLAVVQEMFMHYHRIFDAYHAYEGLGNLYAVNRGAAEAPVRAEPELIELLQWIRAHQDQSHGKVNVALGAALSLWHEYRSEGEALPPADYLKALGRHADFDDMIIDTEESTVYFADPHLKLDIGAVAKGYTLEIIADYLLTSAMPSYIISAGGNVRAGQPPCDDRIYWGVSIQDPESEDLSVAGGIKDVLYFNDLSAVTSGDYLRYYVVDGVRYHHIIDPDTLYPSDYMRSVTVVMRDSGLADLMSTTLFLMPYEEGRALVDSLDEVEAYWVLPDGSVRYSEGLEKMLRSQGASSREQ